MDAPLIPKTIRLTQADWDRIEAYRKACGARSAAAAIARKFDDRETT